MTFNPLAALAVHEVLKKRPGLKSVCELGNQRFTVTEDILWQIGMKDKPESTEVFYRWLGFEYHLALDVNDRMGAVVCDLNSVITDTSLHGELDLVTNNGTGEHIFNQAAVFENVHLMCKPGGVMLHILPMTPWLNHGFYNFNPVLFRDLALANDYQWLFFWIADRWGARTDFKDLRGAFAEKKPTILCEAARDVSKHNGADVSIVAAFEKTGDKPFRYPFQGKYLNDIDDEKVKRDYAIAPR